MLLTHLADEDGEEEVVDEECLRVRLVVVAEEEVREHDDHVLVRRVREAAAEHLHAAQHHQRRRHAAGHNETYIRLTTQMPAVSAAQCV